MEEVTPEDATGLTNDELINKNFEVLFTEDLPALLVLTAQNEVIPKQVEYFQFMREWLTEVLTELDKDNLWQRLADQGSIPHDHKERLVEGLAAIDTVLKEEGKEMSETLDANTQPATTKRKPRPLPPVRPLKDVVLDINDGGILYHLRKAVQNDISHVVLHLKMPHIQAEHGYALRCVEIITDLPVYVSYRIVEADAVVFNTLRDVATIAEAYAALEELRPSIRRGWPLEVYGVYADGHIDGTNLLQWRVHRTY